MVTADAQATEVDGRQTTRKRLAASYVFTVYLLAAASETYMSPMFPRVREDLDLVVAQQAALVAVLTAGIGIANLVGGAAGYHIGDRIVIRFAAVFMAIGAMLTSVAHSYVVLLVAQGIAGIGIGLFFAPGLATIGRLFASNRGRAVASYGLGYSFGTAIGVWIAGVDAVSWRLVFFITACASLVAAVVAPRLADASSETPPKMLASLRGYLRSASYRMSLVTALVAGSMTYLFIGFFATAFVDRGVQLAIVTSLVALGRLASVGSKYVAGWMFDRFGGPRAAQWVMLCIGVLGVPLVALPGRWGVVMVAPFVLVTGSLFPISNALSVAGLPARSTWGIGVYRAILVGSSALLSAVVGVLLHWIGLTTVMAGSLVIPFAAALAARLMVRRGETQEASIASASSR